jgi:hypothetical protein
MVDARTSMQQRSLPIDPRSMQKPMQMVPGSSPALPPRSGGENIHQQQPAYQGQIVDKQCIKNFVIPKPKGKSAAFRELTPTDEYYFDYPHAPQRICYRFKNQLDPMLLAQTLDKALEEIPMCASKVCNFQGKRNFHVGCEQAKLPMVLVEPKTLSQYLDLSFLCERMMQGTPPDVPLFQPYLFRAEDPSFGCTLVVCFHHVLGDATCYAKFLSKWSQMYEQYLQRPGYTPHDLSDIPRKACGPKDLLRSKVPLPSQQKETFARRYFFGQKHLSTLKTELGANPERVSTNDVLMAQFCCAIGPHRKAQLGGTSAYIALLADHRGRGLDEDMWGNATVDLSIFVSWDLIETGDVIGVAKDIRRQIKSELDLLGKDIPAFNTRRFESAKKPRFLCWNSWLKAGRSMIDSRFGSNSGMFDFEWLNLLHHTDINTALTVPSLLQFGTEGSLPPQSTSCLPFAGSKQNPYLAVQVALQSQAEIESLHQWWGDGATVKRVNTVAQC